MSYSLLQLVQKFNSLQSQVNNVVGNLKKFTSLDNFNSLKSQINNTVTNLQNLILNYSKNSKEFLVLNYNTL